MQNSCVANFQSNMMNAARAAAAQQKSNYPPTPRLYPQISYAGTKPRRNMAVASNARRVNCGLDFSIVTDIKTSLEIASSNCYDFMCVPISHPRFKREFMSDPAKERKEPFTRSDLTLSSDEWNSSVVVKCSEYIDCDSPDDTVRKQSEQTLLQEVQFASHLAVSVALISLKKSDNTNLARIIHSKMSQFQQIMSCPIWIQVPMVCPSVQAKHYCTNASRSDPDTWEWWNTFRSLCYHDKRIGLVLELSSDLPSNEEILRWLGEPVKCLAIPSKIFLTNKKGFPVLSKSHQGVVKAFADMGVQVIISGGLRHESATHYVKYIDHLWQTMYSGDPLSAFAQGFEDYLQIPLQPLMDNLDSNTYEVFEKDPVKYSEYQRAIYCALLDRVPDDQKETNTQIVMVVGAGRGPLVMASLTAAKKADRKIRVYAVEKNPSAIVTLMALKEELFGDQVTIVSSDMREWEAPELADIIVSELLGSFGDNELSPECLDGAQKFLKDDGISIPSSYTSYLVPVHSPKLYSEVIVRIKDASKPSESYNFETPYVCHQQTRFQLAPVQPLFKYHHPNKDEIIDNSRYKSLTFQIKSKCLLHGFTGYFDAVLYKDVMLSIEPSTYSQGMVSWFPIFFPIKNPIMLKAGDDLTVHFWRLHNKRDVWYEWALTSPVPTPIHNPNGRAYSIGL